MKRFLPALVLLTAAMLLLTACSQMSVKHLNRNIWELETERSLPMKFWRFDYRITPVRDQFAVRGTAFPLTRTLPAWARWIDDIWFAAYLSDKEGTVIAQDLRVSSTGLLDIDAGVPVEFTLRPESLPTSGELYITFGYRIKLVPEPVDKKHKTPPADVFFASEGAMTRF